VAQALGAAAAARRDVVVHVHGTLDPVSSAGAYAALHSGRPLVLGPFGTLSRYTFASGRARRKRWYFRAVDAPLLRRATAHFTSDGERDDAARHGIRFRGGSYVVPPPWRGAHEPDRHAAYVRGGATVLFLGRLDPVKGIELLLDAWPTVRARCPGARLVIAGGGPDGYVARLRARARALPGGDDDVSFAGFVSGAERTRALAEAAVCVLPSWHESFGVAVLDALGAGVPVVVTPTVALAAFVESSGLGIVSAATPEAVAAAVVSVVDDATLRSHAAAAGPAVVEHAFAPGVVAPALLAMYEGAVRSTRGCGAVP
jgi:glycosyltransferase involved in cell wall biosynthesis